MCHRVRTVCAAALRNGRVFARCDVENGCAQWPQLPSKSMTRKGALYIVHSEMATHATNLCVNASSHKSSASDEKSMSRDKFAAFCLSTSLVKTKKYQGGGVRWCTSRRARRSRCTVSSAAIAMADAKRAMRDQLMT